MGEPVSSNDVSTSTLGQILESEQFNSNNALAAFNKLQEKQYLDRIRELYSVVNKGTNDKHLVRFKLLRLSEMNLYYSLFNIFKMHFNITAFCLRKSIETACFSYQYIESNIDSIELDDIYIRKDERKEDYNKYFWPPRFPENDQRMDPLKMAYDTVNDWGCHMSFKSAAGQVKMGDDKMDIQFFDNDMAYIDNLMRYSNYIINTHFNILNIHYLASKEIVSDNDYDKLVKYYGEYEEYKNSIRPLLMVPYSV